MTRIILGNLLSLSSAVMLCLSSLTRDKRKCYLYQAIECVILLIAQAVFGKASAVIVMFIALLRNILIYYRFYNASYVAIVFIFTGILGAAFNTDGIIGLIPTIAAMIYSITAHLAKSFAAVKSALLLNLVAWVVYSFLIYDFASVLINITAAILNLCSIMIYYKKICKSDSS